jgi:hypothetical protein
MAKFNCAHKINELLAPPTGIVYAEQHRKFKKVAIEKSRY